MYSSRRRFLQQAGIVGAASWLPPVAFGEDVAEHVHARAPLTAPAFTLLPLGSIRPAGWLRAQLEIQANGLSGHLGETWADVGPNSGWLGGSGESWERGPYYLDGLVPLAYLLDDARLKGIAQKFRFQIAAKQQGG